MILRKIGVILFSLLGVCSFSNANEYALDTITACLALEAGCDGVVGMEAVMFVIHNRAVKNKTNLYTEVIKPKQFSALNRSNYIYRARQDAATWLAARRVLDSYIYGDLLRKADPTRGATHFANVSLLKTPKWTAKMYRLVKIGNHTFYREW